MGVYYGKPKRPYISKNDLDDEATLFLCEYAPMCLHFPSAVPAKQIAANMGLTLVADKYLTEDESILGMMCFSEGFVDYYDDITGYYERLPVESGTMLIDPRACWSRNDGCYNNTFVHELFHWHRHKEYFQSLPSTGEEAVSATRCTRKQIEEASYLPRRTDIDWIEWQASSITPRILMPRDSFEQIAFKAIREYEGMFRSTRYYLQQVLTEIVDVFHVSRQSACIRLMETNLFNRHFAR